MEVKGVVSTFMATVDVIRHAIDLGANFIITHEPTWFSGADDTEWLSDDPVYLEKKKKKADKPNYDHVVQVGESMHSIAQMYGIQIKSLYKMNKKDKDYIPEEGDVLKLR